MFASVYSASVNEGVDTFIHSGAVFADLELLPNLGAWHGSECKSTISRALSFGLVLWNLCDGFLPQTLHLFQKLVPLLFGTFNRSTATAAEAELSQSLQTAFANFVKDPLNASPAPNWPPYEPGFLGIADIPTLAEIAYAGNVGFGDFVKPVQPISKVSMRKLYPKPLFHRLTSGS